MPDADTAAKRRSESMLASATHDATPRVGIVLSSFRGSEEHDGTPIPGLSDPRPADAVLNAAQMTALVRKALALSARTLQGGGGPTRVRRGPAGDEWVVFLVARAEEISTDPQLLAAVLEDHARQGRARRVTVAAEGAPLPEWTALLLALAARYREIRFEYSDLSTAPCLEAPPPRRTYAARHASGAYSIPRVIRECDRLISLAPLRTCPLTGVALTIGNYWSLAPRAVYGKQREELLALGDAVDVLSDLYLYHPADFAIAGGPLHRDASGTLRHNIVIAGAKALAVDAVAAAVMGFDPRKLPLFDKLELRGFGIRDPDAVWTRGNTVEEALRPFRKPAAWENA